MKRFLFALMVLVCMTSLFSNALAQIQDPCLPVNIHDTIAFCDGDSVSYHGHWYYQPGDYADTTYDASGCMIIYHLHLTLPTIYPAPARMRSATYRYHCEGDSIMIGRNWVKQPGVYYDTLRASYGCDSIDTVYVYFAPVYEFTDTVSVCDSFFYHGQYYYTTGDYNVYYTTVQGCDSIYRLHLKVSRAITTVNYDTICYGEPYEFCGFNLTTTGEYTCRTKGEDGCDSTVTTLHLTVLECDTATALDNASLYDITLIPNPVGAADISYLYADFADDQLDGMVVEVMTPTGILLNSIRPTQFPLAIPAVNAPGTYIIRITTPTQIYTRKLIVN